MRNYVEPINALDPIEERIIEFKGINRKSAVEDGEMNDMLNMSSSKYPLLAPRPLRGTYNLPADVLRPLKLATRYNKLAMIALKTNDSIAFYFDGQERPEVTGLTSSSEMVIINTKICFFPEKTYLEVLLSNTGEPTIGEYGALDNAFNNASEGLAVDVVITDDALTFTLPSGHGFGYDDALNITGSVIYTKEGVEQSTNISISAAVLSATDTTIGIPADSVIELQGATDITFRGTIRRDIPEMDFVTEWNNRLWGANSRDNTIYASKLGDPKNWQYFQGTSLDSFYAQQGTDGQWTGVAPYSGHLAFFKESSICRIYGTSPQNYQIANVEAYGVEKGSRQSVVTINDTVFYKSQIGIMAYDGSVPICISEKFNRNFRNVIGGTEGIKYYASIQVADGGYEHMVFDIEKGIWHKEDTIRMRNACTVNNRMYFIEYEDAELLCADDLFVDDYLIMGSEDVEGHVGISNPVTPSESYVTLPSMAIFGPFDEYVEEYKIYSKLSLRLIIHSGTELNVYMRLDDGEWELIKAFAPAETHGEVIPIVPRRCDRYSVKIEATGNYEVKSLTRRIRKGSFVRP